jgi:hypothetical protein
LERAEETECQTGETAQPPAKRARLDFDLKQDVTLEIDTAHKITKPKRKPSRPIRRIPIDDANLRRSKRSNKYDGFKVNQPSDRRTVKSEVIPRTVPTAIAMKQTVEGGGKKEIPGPANWGQHVRH